MFLTSQERNKKNHLLWLFLHGASVGIPHFELQEFPRNSFVESGVHFQFDPFMLPLYVPYFLILRMIRMNRSRPIRKEHTISRMPTNKPIAMIQIKDKRSYTSVCLNTVLNWELLEVGTRECLDESNQR